MNPLYQIVAQCQGLEVRIIGALPAPLFFLTLVTLGLALHVRSAIVHVSVPCGTNHGVGGNYSLRKFLDSSELEKKPLDLIQRHIAAKRGIPVFIVGDVAGDRNILENVKGHLPIFRIACHLEEGVLGDDDGTVGGVRAVTEGEHGVLIFFLRWSVLLPYR